MKIFAGILGVIVAAAVIVGMVIWDTNNGLVSADEQVGQAYAQVQNVMQRQNDLIPNMVETVKAYAAYEGKTLTAVTEARSQLGAVAKIDPNQLANDQDLQKKLVEAQQAMGRALVQLNATREAYPALQANDNFKALMVELEGSQNRITVERKKAQEATQAYNVKVRSWPSSMIAEHQGYKIKPYYVASAEAQTAPKVKF